MFQKDDYVIYGNSGICRVEDVGVPENYPIVRAGRLYYTLVQVFGSGTIYAPVDTQVYMRNILTKQEAETLIEQIPEIEAEAFAGQDVRTLSENYREDLVRLIKTIFQKKQSIAGSGKKLAKTEQDFDRVAKDLLHQEFSIALEIPLEAVEEYILTRVRATQG